MGIIAPPVPLAKIRAAQGITPLDADSPAALEPLALEKSTQEYAFLRSFFGPDGGAQFRVEYTPASVTEWRVTGGIANGSPGLAAWSETQTNVSGTIALKGTGGLYVGNGGGVLGGFVDNGLGLNADAYAALSPGSINTAAQVKAFSTTGVTKVGLALVPAGDGALTRAYPDGTAAGGIVRGPYAVDWQAERTLSVTVAQGSRSTIGGGSDNSTSAGAQFSTIAGGNSNLLSGSYSWTPGGILGDDRGRIRAGVWGAGQFSTRGDFQASEVLLRASVTNATPTRMTADNAAASTSNTNNLPNNGTYLMTLMLSARQTGGSAGTAGDTAWRVVVACVKRGANAAATALVGTPATLASGSDTGASAWTWTFAADATNGGVAITFTGEANKTIRSVVRIMGVEVVG
jgi:hypothetical protein